MTRKWIIDGMERQVAVAPAQVLSGDALQGALDNAEAICTQRRERMTPAHRRVLELLLGAERPLKAYDLMGDFGEGRAFGKPAMIYRALAFLQQAGLAHRIERLNAYVACRLGSEHHDPGFLLCDGCREALEFEPDWASLLTSAGVAGYFLHSPILEVTGLCLTCRRNRATD